MTEPALDPTTCSPAGPDVFDIMRRIDQHAAAASKLSNRQPPPPRPPSFYPRRAPAQSCRQRGRARGAQRRRQRWGAGITTSKASCRPRCWSAAAMPAVTQPRMPPPSMASPIRSPSRRRPPPPSPGSEPARERRRSASRTGWRAAVVRSSLWVWGSRAAAAQAVCSSMAGSESCAIAFEAFKWDVGDSEGVGNNEDGVGKDGRFLREESSCWKGWAHVAEGVRVREPN